MSEIRSLCTKDTGKSVQWQMLIEQAAYTKTKQRIIVVFKCSRIIIK